MKKIKLLIPLLASTAMAIAPITVSCGDNGEYELYADTWNDEVEIISAPDKVERNHDCVIEFRCTSKQHDVFADVGQYAGGGDGDDISDSCILTDSTLTIPGSVIKNKIYASLYCEYKETKITFVSSDGHINFLKKECLTRNVSDFYFYDIDPGYKIKSVLFGDEPLDDKHISGIEDARFETFLIKDLDDDIVHGTDYTFTFAAEQDAEYGNTLFDTDDGNELISGVDKGLIQFCKHYCNNAESVATEEQAIAKIQNDLVGRNRGLKLSTGGEYRVKLIDCAHDILTEDTNKRASLTFEFVDLPTDMSYDAGNDSCWYQDKNHHSDAGDYCNNTLINLIPFSANIKTVNKETSEYWKPGKEEKDRIVTTPNKMFVLSNAEYGVDEGCYGYGGFAYKYYENLGIAETFKRVRAYNYSAVRLMPRFAPKKDGGQALFVNGGILAGIISDVPTEKFTPAFCI